MAQDRAGELGEEALNEVKPGAVLGREGEREAPRRLSGKPGFGFSGDVRRVVVQDQLDRRTGRVSVIKELEEFDKLAAAMAVQNLAATEDHRRSIRSDPADGRDLPRFATAHRIGRIRETIPAGEIGDPPHVAVDVLADEN